MSINIFIVKKNEISYPKLKKYTKSLCLVCTIIGLMKKIENQTLDEERALYSISDVTVKRCFFTGPKDGESALKECKNIKVEESFFNLRYPFWHDDKLTINKCELTDKCRTAL